MSEPVRDDFDGPWKEALETYLHEFFAFCLPRAEAEIDWRRSPQSLDSEFQKVAPAVAGPHRVDKLVRVWLRDGQDVWVLVHIDVQSQRETAFAERMFSYLALIWSVYHHEVVSIGVLCDEQLSWQPRRFSMGRWGSSLTFEYPMIKLAMYRERRAELEASENPFAMVFLAHLAAQDTAGRPEQRRRVKWTLTRMLYEKGYSRERIQALFRLIDWLLALPGDEAMVFRREIAAYEEERQMAYITSIEQLAREEGRQEGRTEGRQEGLYLAVRRLAEARFGAVPPALDRRLAQSDEAQATHLLDRLIAGDSLEALLNAGS